MEIVIVILIFFNTDDDDNDSDNENQNQGNNNKTLSTKLQSTLKMSRMGTGQQSGAQLGLMPRNTHVGALPLQHPKNSTTRRGLQHSMDDSSD
eukprot:UN03559